MGNFPKIPFNKPFIAGKELSNITEAVQVEGYLAGDGKFTRKSQAWLENRLGCERALLTHSCTAALEMAALLCGIQPGDEVIMPSFTFVSTANAFALRGGMPVFVDIWPESLNIDEEQCAAVITRKTKAIVPVHYAGRACAMQSIMNLADEQGLWVVEDSAQAFLAKYQDRFLGTIGHIGCLSFHETKNIISGEGGTLLINHPALIKKAEIIREKGTDRSSFLRGETDKYTWQDLGSSFLPSELTAAFLHAQLQEADRIIQRRREIFRRYLHGLKPLAEKGLARIPEPGADEVCNGHLFYLLTNSNKERDGLIKYLRDRDVQALFHYIPLHSSPAGKKMGRAHGDMQVTNWVSECLVRLPLYFEMQEAEVDFVIDKVQEFYRS
ncbi:MAG: dTDP-4-amino-4,6-dideoxygalactose transaminase [Desulfohalobiaceae bacterium]